MQISLQQGMDGRIRTKPTVLVCFLKGKNKLRADIKRICAAVVTAIVCLLFLPGITARAATAGEDPVSQARQEILKDKADLKNQPWTKWGSSEFEIITWPEKTEITVKVKIVYEDTQGVRVPVPGIQLAMSDILPNGKSGTPFDGTPTVTGEDGTVAFVLKDFPKTYRIHLSHEGTYLGAYDRYFYENDQVEVIVLYRKTPEPTAAPTVSPVPTVSPAPTASPAPTVSQAPAGTPENPVSPDTGTDTGGDSPGNALAPIQEIPVITAEGTARPIVTLSPAPEPTPESTPELPEETAPDTESQSYQLAWIQKHSICPMFHWVELLLILLLAIYTAIRCHRIHRYLEWLDRRNDGKGMPSVASAGQNGDRTERCRSIRRRQRMAIGVHALFILTYITMGILLGVLSGHCRLDVPLYVIYTVEILVCSILLYRAERRLWRRLGIPLLLTAGDDHTISTDREGKK